VDRYGGVHSLLVLDTKSQNIPEVVVARRGAGGVPGIWGRVGQLGEGE
jgi:hypothetical protein